MTHDSIDHVDAPGFFRTARRSYSRAIEPGHKDRACYTQAIEGGSARVISDENVQGAVPTADGKFVFGFSDVVALYPVDGQGSAAKRSGHTPAMTLWLASRRMGGRRSVTTAANFYPCKSFGWI